MLSHRALVRNERPVVVLLRDEIGFSSTVIVDVAHSLRHKQTALCASHISQRN